MAFFREKVFPLLSGAAWLTFLALDLTGGANSTWVKFAAICLCAVTAWTGAVTTDGRLVALALCFTVAADWFLLVRDTRYTLGLCLFLVVQGLYAYRLYRLRGNRVCKWGVALRLLALFGVLLLFPLAYGLFSYCLQIFTQAPAETVFHLPAFVGALTSFALPLLALPLLYFSNLCVNTAEAFALNAPKPTSRFAWGLLLFIGCDLCVGCWNMGLLGDFARVGMWLFYLPSQVLIVLSQDTKGAFQ